MSLNILHSTDSNVPLFTAAWLAGNSHLKLPVFKQRLQIVCREVLDVFKATMVGDFCLAARFGTECNNSILEGDLGGNLGGDLGGTPHFAECLSPGAFAGTACAGNANPDQGEE